LGVLRVLTKQTLEISSLVKDFTFPDPSLAKEVKDSSLINLHQFLFSSDPFQSFICEAGRNIAWRGASGSGKLHILGLYQFLLVGIEFYTSWMNYLSGEWPFHWWTEPHLQPGRIQTKQGTYLVIGAILC
jgi:hypothetical protein